MLTKWVPLSTVVFALITGCEEGPIPIETAPVSGTAMFEDKPLKDYRVFFYSSGHPAQEPATGRVGEDGRFTLGIRQPNDGAMVGPNQIWLKFDPPMPESIAGTDAPWTPPAPTIKIPEKYLDRDKSELKVDVPVEGLKDYKIELKE